MSKVGILEMLSARKLFYLTIVSTGREKSEDRQCSVSDTDMYTTWCSASTVVDTHM